MPSLLVRNLDKRIVDTLKRRAVLHGHSAEAEHRAILASALLGPKKKNFAECLSAMPNVGRDDDFTRTNDEPEKSHVFD